MDDDQNYNFHLSLRLTLLYDTVIKYDPSERRLQK